MEEATGAEGQRGSDVEQVGSSGPSRLYDELERALSSVPGIVNASVTVSEETGRGRLRIRLAAGEDADAVSWAVAATLRERFGIALDPGAIRPRSEGDGEHLGERTSVADLHGQGTGGDAYAAPIDGAGLARAATARRRAAIRELVTRQGERDVEVTATLEVAGQRGCSVARGLPTRRGVWRAVAEATLGALGELTGDRLHAAVDRVSVTSSEDPAMATVVVSILSDRGEELLLGASLVRDDPEGAVMRATLDALNRRVEPWLSTG
jgi:hypothetical protein